LIERSARRQNLRDVCEFSNDLRIPGAAHRRSVKTEREKKT
jgi:hypothetical protein